MRGETEPGGLTMVGLLGGNSHQFLFPLLPEQTLSHGAALDGGANCSFLCRKLRKHVEPHFSMWFLFSKLPPSGCLAFSSFRHCTYCSQISLGSYKPWPWQWHSMQLRLFESMIAHRSSYYTPGWLPISYFCSMYFPSKFLPLVLCVNISTTCTLSQNFYHLYFASKFLPLLLCIKISTTCTFMYFAPTSWHIRFSVKCLP